MTQGFLAIAAIFGGTAVAAGAFGSHALRTQLSDRALEIFETGVRYQMYHALALLAVGLWLSFITLMAPTVFYGNNIVTGAVVSPEQIKSVTLWLTIAGYAFIGGILVFSGSLYILSVTNIRWLGAVTPLGGACFLVGWSCLAIAAYQTR